MNSINPEIKSNNDSLQKDYFSQNHTNAVQTGGHHFVQLNHDDTKAITDTQSVYESFLGEKNNTPPIQQQFNWIEPSESHEEILENDAEIENSEDDDEILEDYQSDEEALEIQEKIESDKLEIATAKLEEGSLIEDWAETKLENREQAKDLEESNETMPLNTMLFQSAIQEFEEVESDHTEELDHLSEDASQLEISQEKEIHLEEKEITLEEELSDLNRSKNEVSLLVSDIVRDYKSITLEDGKSLSYEINLIKDRLESGEFGPDVVRESLDKLLEALKGASHPDGTPLTEDEIATIRERISSALTQYITIHFKIKEIENKIDVRNQGDEAVSQKDTQRTDHFANNQHNLLGKVKRDISVLAALADKTGHKKLSQRAQIQLMNRIQEMKRTLNKWRQEKMERKVAKDRMQIEGKILNKQILDKEISANEIKEIILNIQALQKFLAANRTNFTQKEWIEICLFIDSTTGLLEVEREQLMKTSSLVEVITIK